jgi:hypothetical protein
MSSHMSNPIPILSAPINHGSSRNPIVIDKANIDNIANSSSIDVLTNCVPTPFKNLYRKAFGEWFALGQKISHASNALVALKRYETTGTFPPSILGAIKMPTVQVAKEFSTQDVFATWSSTIQTTIHNVRVGALQECIKIKSEEGLHLEGLISDEETTSKNKLLVDEIKELSRSRFSDTPDLFYREEERTCRDLGVRWLQRAAALGLAHHQREIEARQQKSAKTRDADVEMKNTQQGDIQKTVEAAVAAALKKAGHKPPVKGKPTSSKGKPRASSKKSLTPRDSTNNLHRQQSLEAASGQEPQYFPEAQCRQKRKRKWEWERQTQREIEELDRQLSQSPQRFKPWDADTYPTKWFEARAETRTRWLLLHSSLDYVDSLAAYQSDVFTEPGMSLRGDIKQTLSLNGKFIPHTKPQPQLVLRAFQELQRSVRTKYEFRDKKHEYKTYIPKFYTKSEDWEPPYASEALERCLVEIKENLNMQISCFHSRPKHRLNPNLQELKQYLTQMNFLVKITDKNLGLSVVSLDWYRKQCLLHLSNTAAYERVEPKALEQVMKNELLTFTKDAHLPAIFRKYIGASKMEYPRFYVIPKVHKNPWASRPIIPSHSWITSRVAAVVDYALQPLLREFKTVLNSSQELISKLREVGPMEGCWLITGDVTAMYTNIDPFDAIRKITSILPATSQGIRRSTLVKMIEFVLLNNFFMFENDIYQQKSGLAMGVSCAPIIANLYCAVYEKDMLKYRTGKTLKVYARYIDDIFVIFKGTEDEKETWTAKWKLPGLKITWESSRSSTSFLDIKLQIINGELVTSLYEKALNTHAYIPFSSAHPLPVKKAFVKAERMRFKMICSREPDFRACERNFYLNLLKRGYPARHLIGWFEEPLAPIERDQPALILPSEYNPIWEHMRIGPITELLASQDEVKLTPVVTSLKRGRSIFDILNLHNLTLSDSIKPAV